MGLYYIGVFPPPYGGVTIKNRNLFLALEKHLPIGQVDLGQVKQKRPGPILHFLSVLTGRKNHFVVGVTGRNTCRRFCRLLTLCNPGAMSRSVIMLMGGQSARYVAENRQYIRDIGRFQRIFVETDSMAETLRSLGLTRVSVYPNGRFRPTREMPPRVGREGRLQCVYFSQIREEKGVEHILQAAALLPGVDFTFYGPIFPDVETVFRKAMDTMPNVRYRGVFTGEAEAVYGELSRYHVLLFPTKYKTEGVPGVFAEAKIAGLPIVASSESYNAELVADGREGLILEENTPEQLARAIETLDCDRALLASLSQGSRASAERFYIENYIEEIAEILNSDF